MLIAAHARSEGLIVVTNNLREFDRVPGLRTENWVGRGELPARLHRRQPDREYCPARRPVADLDLARVRLDDA